MANVLPSEWWVVAAAFATKLQFTCGLGVALQEEVEVRIDEICPRILTMILCRIAVLSGLCRLNDG